MKEKDEDTFDDSLDRDEKNEIDLMREFKYGSPLIRQIMKWILIIYNFI